MTRSATRPAPTAHSVALVLRRLVRLAPAIFLALRNGLDRGFNVATPVRVLMRMRQQAIAVNRLQDALLAEPPERRAANFVFVHHLPGGQHIVPLFVAHVPSAVPFVPLVSIVPD